MICLEKICCTLLSLSPSKAVLVILLNVRVDAGTQILACYDSELKFDAQLKKFSSRHYKSTNSSSSAH